MDSTASRTPVLRAVLGHLAWMQLMIGIACVVGIFTSMRVAAIIAIGLILLVSGALAIRRATFKMDQIFDEELDRQSSRGTLEY